MANNVRHENYLFFVRQNSDSQPKVLGTPEANFAVAWGYEDSLEQLNLFEIIKITNSFQSPLKTIVSERAKNQSKSREVETKIKVMDDQLT